MNTRVVNQKQQYTFKVGNHQGQVVIIFPQPVRDVSFDPTQARAVADLLLEHADLASRQIILPAGMTREKPKSPRGGNGEP